MRRARHADGYKSPKSKLARFFRKSRDRWKEKARESKAVIRRLKNRIGFLERSKARLQDKFTELEQELCRVKRESRERAEELEAVKKDSNAPTTEALEAFERVPACHAYSIGHVSLFLSLVLSAASSLRGASRCMEIFMRAFELEYATPSWWAGRLWLLRLGYYKLMQAQEHAGDWVWIVDHTVQLGVEKCLVILGIRLSNLPVGRSVGHADVEPLALYPVKHSNGEVVFEQLEQSVSKTGVPREIVADHGSDLEAGIERFCKAHPETVSVYDIKHESALLLKHLLQADEDWEAFTSLAARTKSQLQQTALAFLAAPNQRSKARYMNLDTLIGWGTNVLEFLDSPKGAEHNTQGQLEEKLGWVKGFRAQLQEWNALLELTTTAESVVRTQGIYRGCEHVLDKQLVSLVNTPRTEHVREQLVRFAARQALKARAGERLLGSSEVIESMFGKLKRIERDQARSGFTALVLSIPAMVSTTTQEVIHKALETVPTKKIAEWSKEFLGKSIQAQRKEAFRGTSKKEQNRDQLHVAT